MKTSDFSINICFQSLLTLISFMGWHVTTIVPTDNFFFSQKTIKEKRYENHQYEKGVDLLH